jgi:hypothetical protein
LRGVETVQLLFKLLDVVAHSENSRFPAFDRKESLTRKTGLT